MPPIGDANIGFTLTPDGRTRLIRALDSLTQAIPQSVAVLIDLAGRIVDVPKRPPGVNLEAISALAAGCHASTTELAVTMGEKAYALLFEHGDDRQVYVRPVGERALLIVLLKGAASVELLETHMEGKLGTDIDAVVKEAREPMKTVPPPRIEPAEGPSIIEEKVRTLNAFIMDIQTNKPAALAGERNKRLLKAREELVQAMSHGFWDKASEICDETRVWLSAP